MKVLFVDLCKDLYDPHGVYSLSAAMEQHRIEVYFIREANYKKLLFKIKEKSPDLLLYSSFSANVFTYVDFDRIVKSTMKIKSIIGGPGPTFDWKCINNSTIDAACIGEGEFALVDFIRNGLQSSKNIFCNGEGKPSEFYPFVELDTLPFPNRDGIYLVDSVLKNMPSKQFISGRGCPYDCSYCFNHNFREIFKGCGPLVRKKSVNYMLEEIRNVKKKYPLLNVVFNDDTFIIDKKWFLEFCERFPREIGLTYTCNIRADLTDEEIVKALRK